MAEELTKEAVTELLRARLNPGWRCTELSRTPAGNAQETWFVTAVDGAGAERGLVLRRSAASSSLGHTDRGREAAILAALSGRGLPVPAVHWSDPDGGELGRPYFVMERLPGAPAPSAPAASRRQIARELGERLAALHELDPATLAIPGAAPDPSAAAATRRELAAWRGRYTGAAASRVPALGALLAWLEANPPAREDVPARALWGDPGPHNLLVEDGAITGLLDWELWHWGDPLEDLGAALWAAPAAELDPEDVIASYERRAGAVDRDALRYFEAMACVDRAVILLALVDSFLGGEARPSAAALGQRLLLRSLERAAELAGWPPPAAPEDPPLRPVPPLRLRPDAVETTVGVAAFLRASILPQVADRRARHELKVATALLEDAAARTAREEVGAADVEAAAIEAERRGAPERERLRAQVLADLAAQRRQIGALDRLYGDRL